MKFQKKVMMGSMRIFCHWQTDGLTEWRCWIHKDSWVLITQKKHNNSTTSTKLTHQQQKHVKQNKHVNKTNTSTKQTRQQHKQVNIAQQQHNYDNNIITTTTITTTNDNNTKHHNTHDNNTHDNNTHNNNRNTTTTVTRIACRGVWTPSRNV